MALIIQLLFQSETGISLSFILSYLALGGMLTLGDTLRTLFKGRLPDFFARGLSASLGAFIATAPVVVLFFGTLKPIGILAGLLIAPLASLFMILALAALVAAFLPFPLWDILDLILSGFYRFLEFVVSLAGQVPGFKLSNPVPVLVVSILLWLFVLFIKKQDDIRRNSVASFG
jgi:competence protein ComEC